MESLLPDDVRPMCDSVVAQVFVSGIYGLIHKLIPVFRYSECIVLQSIFQQG